MLRYSLICEKGHEFEGWFSGSAGYDQQRRRGLIACAHCGSTKIEKAIMAPAVARRDRDRPSVAESAGPEIVPAPAPAQQPVALMSEPEIALRAVLKAVRKHVEATAENVGPAFAETARAIHEGEMEHKSIYGTATPEEIRGLAEDGIEALALPVLPDERN